MMRLVFGFVLALVLAVPAAAQQTAPDPAPAKPAAAPYKISGLVFGDYYTFPKHHLETWEGQNGLWFRRVYLTYDHTFSPTLTTRLRLEMNSNGKLQGGALEPYLKDAYLQWTFSGKQRLTAGIHPSLAFEFVEGVWGLRQIEKTPVDLFRIDSSRETGVTIAGPLNASGTLKYAVQAGNDSGINSETDKRKGFRLAARYETNPGFSLEGMFARSDRAGDADRTTGQIFGAYRGERGRAGAQYVRQTRQAANGSTAPDLELDIYSGFGVLEVRDKTTAFVRVDRYNDPCPDCAGIDYLPIDTTQPFTLTIAGIDYAVHPAVRISPNVEWVKYGSREGSTTSPADDLAARLTFSWAW